MAYGSVSSSKLRLRKYQKNDDTRLYFVLECVPNGRTREIPFKTGFEALRYKNDRKNSVAKHQIFSRCKKCHTKRKHDAGCPFYKRSKKIDQSRERGQYALPFMKSTTVSSTAKSTSSSACDSFVVSSVEKDVSSSDCDGGSLSSTAQFCDDEMGYENRNGSIPEATEMLKLYIEEFWETVNQDLPSRKINMRACPKDQIKLNRLQSNRFPFPNPLLWGKQQDISNAKSACAFFLMESILVVVDPVMFYYDRFENEYSCQKWTCPKCDKIVGEAITSAGWQPNFRVVKSIDGNINKVLKVAQYKHISCESVFGALEPKLVKQFPIELQHEVGAIVNSGSRNLIDVSWGTYVRAATAAGLSFRKQSEIHNEMVSTRLLTFEHSFLHAQAAHKRHVKGTISGMQKASNSNPPPYFSLLDFLSREGSSDSQFYPTIPLSDETIGNLYSKEMARHNRLIQAQIASRGGQQLKVDHTFFAASMVRMKKIRQSYSCVLDVMNEKQEVVGIYFTTTKSYDAMKQELTNMKARIELVNGRDTSSTSKNSDKIISICTDNALNDANALHNIFGADTIVLQDIFHLIDQFGSGIYKDHDLAFEFFQRLEEAFFEHSKEDTINFVREQSIKTVPNRHTIADSEGRCIRVPSEDDGAKEKSRTDRIVLNSAEDVERQVLSTNNRIRRRIRDPLKIEELIENAIFFARQNAMVRSEESLQKALKRVSKCGAAGCLQDPHGVPLYFERSTGSETDTAFFTSRSTSQLESFHRVLRAPLNGVYALGTMQGIVNDTVLRWNLRVQRDIQQKNFLYCFDLGLMNDVKLLTAKLGLLAPKHPLFQYEFVKRVESAPTESFGAARELFNSESWIVARSVGIPRLNAPDENLSFDDTMVLSIMDELDFNKRFNLRRAMSNTGELTKHMAFQQNQFQTGLETSPVTTIEEQLFVRHLLLSEVAQDRHSNPRDMVHYFLYLLGGTKNKKYEKLFNVDFSKLALRYNLTVWVSYSCVPRNSKGELLLLHKEPLPNCEQWSLSQFRLKNAYEIKQFAKAMAKSGIGRLIATLDKSNQKRDNGTSKVNVPHLCDQQKRLKRYLSCSTSGNLANTIEMNDLIKDDFWHGFDMSSLDLDLNDCDQEGGDYQSKQVLQVSSKPAFSSLKSTCPGCHESAAQTGGRIKHLPHCDFQMFRQCLGETKDWPYKRTKRESWFQKCVLLFDQFVQCNLPFDSASIKNFRDNHSTFLAVLQQPRQHAFEKQSKNKKRKEADNSFGTPAWRTHPVTSQGCCGFASVGYYLELNNAKAYITFAINLMIHWGVVKVSPKPGVSIEEAFAVQVLPEPGVPLEEAFGNLVELRNKVRFYLYKISRIGMKRDDKGWPQLDQNCWMSFGDDLIVQSILFNCQFFVYLNPVAARAGWGVQQQLVLIRPFVNVDHKLESKWVMKSRVFKSNKFVSAEILLAAAQHLVDEADAVARKNGLKWNGSYHWINLGSTTGVKLDHFEPLLVPPDWQANKVPGNYLQLVQQHCVLYDDEIEESLVLL